MIDPRMYEESMRRAEEYNTNFQKRARVWLTEKQIHKILSPLDKGFKDDTTDTRRS
jgi:hypothetical protein